MNLIKLFFLASILALATKPATAEFVALKRDDVKPCSFELTEAKNIPHQCKIISDRDNSLEVWQDRLTFDFGKLSLAEFNYLKNVYSGWSKTKTAVVYNSAKHYQLIDFLPPLIQALNNHRFIPESQAINNQQLPSAIQTKQLYMNCWGVTYEVLRAAKNSQAKPAIFMGQGSLVLNTLRRNSQQLLTFSEPEQIPKSVIQPGDVIFVSHKSSTGHEYLDHIAVAIDDGIYFEKAGTGANVPMRIIDESTLRQIWQPGVFNYEVRRLKQNAFLSHPQAMFSLNALAIKKRFDLKKVPGNFKTNTTIMWEEEEKISTASVFYLLNTTLAYSSSRGRAKLMPQLYQSLLPQVVKLIK